MSLDELTAKLDCQDVINRFLGALDTRANADAASLMTSDGVIVIPDGELAGAELRESLLHRTYVSRHVITNTVMTCLDAKTVQCQAYVMTYNVQPRPDEKPPWPMPPGPAAAGNWTILLVKGDEGWRISRIENEVVFQIS
jgi:hypothetical protein